MRNRSIFIISILAVLTLLVTACGSNTQTANHPPTEAPTEGAVSEPEPETEIVPMVAVSDQDASGGTVTIQEVLAADPGWIVIHTEADGAPGPIVGYTQVEKGENTNVQVDIDLDGATEKLFAMLHLDAGTPGTYEFPGDDVPVRTDESVVLAPFMVNLPETSIIPSVSVSDQESSGTVMIEKITSADPGWIVIHTEADGAPGPIIGYAQIEKGENANVEVEIDLDAATEKLFAMLHIDAGTPGTYEFPGDDVPVLLDDAVVMASFILSKAEASTDSAKEDFTVMIKDSKYEQQNLTVKVGTKVTWIMDANFPHTVTADDGSFDSGRMSNGESFSITFEQPGEFPYYCTLHGSPGGGGMAGTVTVIE